MRTASRACHVCTNCTAGSSNHDRTGDPAQRTLSRGREIKIARVEAVRALLGDPTATGGSGPVRGRSKVSVWRRASLILGSGRERGNQNCDQQNGGSPPLELVTLAHRRSAYRCMHIRFCLAARSGFAPTTCRDGRAGRARIRFSVTQNPVPASGLALGMNPEPVVRLPPQQNGFRANLTAHSVGAVGELAGGPFRPARRHRLVQRAASFGGLGGMAGLLVIDSSIVISGFQGISRLLTMSARGRSSIS